MILALVGIVLNLIVVSTVRNQESLQVPGYIQGVLVSRYQDIYRV